MRNPAQSAAIRASNRGHARRMDLWVISTYGTEGDQPGVGEHLQYFFDSLGRSRQCLEQPRMCWLGSCWRGRQPG